MRLGRRLSAGIAEDPPAPAPSEVETPEPVAVAAEPVVETAPDPIATGG
ncbi:hypothetical protein [Actinomycetospora soli]|nr:hypothetical protein [Actinomycetospora soli]MCD2187999.1 hypothetical protein [Actinomycetospora soli]